MLKRPAPPAVAPHATLSPEPRTEPGRGNGWLLAPVRELVRASVLEIWSEVSRPALSLPVRTSLGHSGQAWDLWCRAAVGMEWIDSTGFPSLQALSILNKARVWPPPLGAPLGLSSPLRVPCPATPCPLDFSVPPTQVTAPLPSSEPLLARPPA